MVIKYVIVRISALQKFAIFQHNVYVMMMAIYIATRRRVNYQKKCWQFQKDEGFLEYMLMGSYSNGDFQKRMKVIYICILY